MNKYLLFALAILVLLLAILAGLLLLKSNSQKSVTTTGPATTFPIGSTNPAGSNSGNTTSSTMSISVRNGGSPVVTNDFIHNGVTVADVENSGTYYLAGSVGYCLSNGTCPAGASTTDFNIAYDSTQQYFTIALTKEPLGQSRLDAEAFLLKTLGISQQDEQELCNVNYYLGTDQGVNAFYAGENLGFSFCTGATQLP